MQGDTMKSMSMRLWAGLFVLVVFVAGVAGGVALRPWITPDPVPGFGARGPRGGRPPGPMTDRLLERIAATIDLTPEQDRQLREVFDSRRQRMREINEEIRGRFESQQEQMNAEIAAILTPDQLEIFDDEIIRMRRGRGGPRGRGSPGRSRRGHGPPP